MRAYTVVLNHTHQKLLNFLNYSKYKNWLKKKSMRNENVQYPRRYKANIVIFLKKLRLAHNSEFHCFYDERDSAFIWN